MRRDIFIVLAVSILAGCAAQEQYCFRDHLEEAIALNKERLPQYAALAAEKGDDDSLRKQSERVSNLLIRAERLALRASRLPTWLWGSVNFDRAARKYQAAGIPMVCADFVPMRSTPAMRPGASPYPDPQARVAPRSDYDFDRADYSDFKDISAELEAAIETLSAEPRFDCLHRHILESALRIANHAPMYIALAEKSDLPSPEDLLRRMIDSHFWKMDEIIAIDDAAVPLQARGISIVCSDVPPIPPYSESLVKMYESTL